VFMLAACGKPQPGGDMSAAPAIAVSALRASFSASPNPTHPIVDGRLGQTKLEWTTSAVKFAEIHVGKPDGPLFCKGTEKGSCETGQWVTNGMTFFLQDSTAAKPTDPAATLATVTVVVK
jgi:hypothetical protein